MTTILTVCTANVCRSPVAQAALSSGLAGIGVTVTSAGTQSRPGAAAARESMDFARRSLGRPLTHRARQLDRATSAEADLILTMTLEQRNWVATEEPRAVRRVFTLLELAHIVRVIPPASRFRDIRDFAHACTRLRPRGLLTAGELDIADPHGGPPAGYAAAFALIHEASFAIAHVISRSVDHPVNQVPLHHDDFIVPAQVPREVEQ